MRRRKGVLARARTREDSLASAALRALTRASLPPQTPGFPPYSFVSLRATTGDANSSFLITENVWVAPTAFRFTLSASPTPFGADAPLGYPINVLDDATSRKSYSWSKPPGQPIQCTSRPLDATDPTALCIGGDLSLNSTRVIGGRPAAAWVGFSDERTDGACWHELLIASAESADPAAWLSVTSQCKDGPRGASVQVLSFSDFSTAPFDPSVFVLPKECK